MRLAFAAQSPRRHITPVTFEACAYVGTRKLFLLLAYGV